MIRMWIQPDLNSNVKLIWKRIKVNGTDDVDGDVVMVGVIESGTTVDIFDLWFYFCTCRARNCTPFEIGKCSAFDC